MADEILSDEEVFGGGAAAIQPPLRSPMQAAEDGLLSDEDVFGPRDDALRTTLRASTRINAGRDPALVAESERLARKYGLPVDTAERQIDALRTQEEMAQVDTFAQQAPKVAEWMASDPNAAALGKDDRDGLSALEQAFAIVRPVTDLKQSVMAGVVSGVGSAVSGGGEALNMRGRQIRRWQDATDAAGEGFWRMFSDDLGDRYAANAQAMRDLIPDWMEDPFGLVGGGVRAVGSAIEGFAQENIAVAEDRQNLATDIASGLGSLVPYLAAAYFTGGAGVLGLGAAQGVDTQADRAEGAGTYGTVAADTGQAIGGAVTAVTERMGLGWLMRRLPPGAKNALNKRVADILMGGVGEAAQEMTESAVQDAVTKTLVDESFDMFQGIEREGLAAFGVGLLFRGGVHVARMEADAQQAEVEAETLGNIEAAVGGLKLAELSPERLREVLGRLKNSSVSDVFLPVDKFTALFQSEQEMGDALDAIGVDRAELSLALAENGQVRVPIDGYFTGMTPEQRAAAKPHARLTPAAMTPEEAKSFDREQALREFIEATGEQGRPADDPTNWVYDQVRAQLEAAGTDPAVAEQQAELYAAALRTAIARSGLSIEQLAGTEQDPRLSIRRDTPDAVRRVAEARNVDAALDASIEALRSGRLFTDKEIGGQRLSELIRTQGGIDPSSFGAGDLRAQDANRRGLLRRGGITVEQALEVAIENGFINRTFAENEGVYDPNGADINTLLDLLIGDMGETPAFAPDNQNLDRQAFNEATNELGRMLDELGIGREQLAEMDNAAIRAALGMNGPMDPDGIEFDQSAPVDSQAFRDWFQASKVAKPDGTPLVVYHGTGEEFEAFDKLRLSMGTGHSSSGLGFYFTPSKRSAEGYAEKASDGVPANAVLLEVYLSVQNPYTMTLDEAQGFEDAAEAAVTRMMLQSQGYDGVWIPEQNAWVAFEPTQVKSVENRGTWSRKDPRMLFQTTVQQRTPEFRAWFDGSQVVDEKGEPLVVYHGSDAEFDVFDRKKSRDGRWGKGFYFTTSPEEAAKYGKNVTAVYLKADRLTDTRAGGPGGTTVGEGKFWAMKGKLTAGGGDVYMVTDPRQIKAVTNERPTNDPSIYNQTLDDTKRGSVNIIPGYPGGLDRYLITLGNRADKSTFLHESAHVFLELRKQINAQVAAIPEGQRTKDQQRIVEDDARLLELLGVDSFDAIQRDQHEAFAESFEVYLREGKAPSPRLKRAFQSFRMWLTRIYRTLKGLPNANLTDEVRGYFDRMLATDEEIDAVRSQLSLQPIITEALRGDMSEDEYRRYLLAVETARQSAVEQEGAVQFTYAKREAERLRSAEMKELRAEVEAEINADPVWRAIAMLRTGKTPDGTPLPENEAFKLDTQAVTDLQGKEWVKKNLAGMHRREGGVHPDMAASVLGFRSATEMLQAIASKPTKRDAIEAEALRRWQERNPDPLLDGALEARVTKALHSDAAAEVMVREINALYGNKGLALAPLREYVNRTVGKMAVRNLNPNRHKVAEMRHGRAAFVAAAKGDREGAAQARRSQLMAHLSYRAELDAKERAEAFRAEGVRLSKKPAQERLARAGWEGYLDKVNQILASFDLRRMSNKDIERKKSLRAWVEAQQEAGEITALSEELIARVEAGRVANWREATVGEIDAAADALANIQHLAKIKNKLTAARDGREWDEARTDLLARMQESLPDLIGGEASERDVGDAEGARRGVAGALANLNRPENVIEALDGGESGPWHDYVWTVLQDAENKAVGYRKELGAKLKAVRAEAGDVFKTMQDKVVVKLPNERGQVVDVAVSRATLIGIALNTGNGTNMQRLVDGGIAVGLQRFRLGPQNVQQLLSELRSDELSFVQGMWDTVNSLWPDIVNLQRRMSGLPPEKVEARELTVASKDGKTVTLAGGYWPLVYDSKRSEVGETQDGADAMRMMMGAGFTKAFTPKGYQKARVETFEAPLQLDFAQVMSRHIDHVITDISHREAVRDINRILSDSEIKENLILRVGREGYDNLRGSLSYAVSASSAVAGRVAARWARGLDTVMANTSVAALAIRPDIALGNLTSATIQGLDRVGVKALMRGWWALETSRTRTTEAITSKSAFMAQRLGDTNFFFQQELHRLAGRRGWGPAYRRMMMVLHRAADAEVTRALWWGRYQQALDAGEGESQAVLMADKAVRQTQTANARKDISTFERDTQFKQARQFMGPMFVIFGRLYAAARGEGATQRVGARTSTLLIQAFLAPAIFALAAGRVPEDGDDDEEIGTGDWARWLAVNVGLFPLMTLPYLRDLTAIGEAAITGGQANPRANPTTQAVVSMGRAFQSLGQNAETYGETGEIDYLDATRDIFSILGPIVGAPTAQVRITTKTVESVLDDPEQGKVEMARMAIYGPPRETQ